MVSLKIKLTGEMILPAGVYLTPRSISSEMDCSVRTTRFSAGSSLEILS